MTYLILDLPESWQKEMTVRCGPMESAKGDMAIEIGPRPAIPTRGGRPEKRVNSSTFGCIGRLRHQV